MARNSQASSQPVKPQRIKRGLRIFLKPNSRSWMVSVRFKGQTIRFAAFADKAATIDLALGVQRIATARESNGQLDAASARLVESMPARVRERLVLAGVVPSEVVAAATPLAELIQQYRSALDRKGVTAKHVTLTIHRVTVALSGFAFWSDVTGLRVSARLGELRQEHK